MGIVALISAGGDKVQAEQPHATTSATAAPAGEQNAPPGDRPESEPPSPTVSVPIVGQQSAPLEQVRVIQTPATGGDPGSTFCLVYTGSSSGPEREAILLMNAPAYQCSELLPYDGVNSAFTTEAPLCEAPSRAAVVSFAETGGWENEVMYTCLTLADGA